MGYAAYADPEYYQKIYGGSTVPEESLEKVLRQASRHIDSLTYNRIVEYRTALGGPAMESYGMKYVTFLVHWNKSQRETESAANALFDAVCRAREADINGQQIKFIQPLVSEPVDVGTDDAGIYEMVIEAAVIFGKENEHE